MLDEVSSVGIGIPEITVPQITLNSKEQRATEGESKVGEGERGGVGVGRGSLGTQQCHVKLKGICLQEQPITNIS